MPIIFFEVRSCRTQKVGKKWIEQFNWDVSLLIESKLTWKDGTQRTPSIDKLGPSDEEPMPLILAWDPLGKVTVELIGVVVFNIEGGAIWSVAPLSSTQDVVDGDDLLAQAQKGDIVPLWRRDLSWLYSSVVNLGASLSEANVWYVFDFSSPVVGCCG